VFINLGWPDSRVSGYPPERGAAMLSASFRAAPPPRDMQKTYRQLGVEQSKLQKREH
jgi:hypothetical protein